MRVKELSIVLFTSMALPTQQGLAEDNYPGGIFSPKDCNDNALVVVRPFFPRHVEFPESGCRVIVDFKVLPNGKVQAPRYPDDVAYEDLRKVARIEPEKCSNRYISAVLRSLQKAQFVESQEGFHCTYTYNWVMEP
tara:strand:+ start:374 stop:781 length:408 start_codon:yes stop_codon:yes gene_type:complete